MRRNRSPETVTRSEGSPARDQGSPLSYVAELVRYWAQHYDWRGLEEELNDHGQALTELDGPDGHLLHVRSPRPDTRPLVLSHGWPNSVIEPLHVIDERIRRRRTP